MSGFVIGILQWVALSGWLLATLGLAPLFLYFGVAYDSDSLCRAGMWLQKPVGVTAISLTVALLTTVFLTKGLKTYVRWQNLLFVLTVAGVSAVIGVFYFHRHTFVGDFDTFAFSLAAHLKYAIPGKQLFLLSVKSDVRNSE